MLLVIALEALFQLLGFAGVLWLLSKPLMGILIAYAVAGTVIATLVFGHTLVSINRVQLKREADFRFGLARIRDHAEAIALYEGEAQMYDHLAATATTVISVGHRPSLIHYHQKILEIGRSQTWRLIEANYLSSDVDKSL